VKIIKLNRWQRSTGYGTGSGLLWLQKQSVAVKAKCHLCRLRRIYVALRREIVDSSFRPVSSSFDSYLIRHSTDSRFYWPRQVRDGIVDVCPFLVNQIITIDVQYVYYVFFLLWLLFCCVHYFSLFPVQNELYVINIFFSSANNMSDC
jgi:hypothetical protein